MTYGNDKKIYKNLKNCLVQLDSLFQWLTTIENKLTEKDGAIQKMGSNFAKYKIIPEYISFIQPACKAETHFENKAYPECAERCRNSMGEFLKYLYTKFGWKKPIGTIKPDEPSLDQLLKDKKIKDFLDTKGSKKYTYLKKYGNDATHQSFYKTDIKDAYNCLKDLFYLITKSLSDKNSLLFTDFVGTPRFDISLLANSFKELITPQLTIEVNGSEKNIPQNELLKAVHEKKVTEDLIKENLSLINKTDVLGNTPLSLAVYNDDYDTVKLLLENGADPNFYFSNWANYGFGGDFHTSVKEEIGKAPEIYSCVWSDYIEAHRCIPLIVAIKKDNAAIAELLLQYSAKTWDSCIDDWYNISKIPPECSTVLTCAYYYNAEECIRFLLKKDNIDINQKTISGITPLMLAVENGKNYHKLLKKGAALDIFDKSNNSVFLHAVQNMRHDFELLDELLEQAKGDLDKAAMAELVNHSGNAGCPLSYMNEKEANLYLEYGADINARNNMDVPCLVDAVYLNPELLPWFKAKNAKFDFKAFFYNSSYLQIKKHFRAHEYKRSFFTEVLKTIADYNLIDSGDLNFTVPIENIPYISPLVNAILFKNAKSIQMKVKYEENKIIYDSKKYELKISPLDDAVIAKNYEAAAIYLSKGISVSELSKILLLNVHEASEKVCKTLKKRRDIDFSNVLITLCKNHPKEDFDIAKEFINNGYNFYKFAKYNLLPDFTDFFVTDILNFDYKSNMVFIKNENGLLYESPSTVETRKRNNNSFLNKFNETSFQDVNLRLIKTAISFGADSSLKDETGKNAIDYAKENGIDEVFLKAEALLHKGVIANLRHDKTDTTKIFDGRIESNGKLYNFRKLFDKNNQEIKYKPSYKERTVTFEIIRATDGSNPGFAINVTLTDN